MTHSRKNSTFLFLVGFLALSFVSLFYLIQSNIFQQHGKTLSAAVTLDFLITIPVVYFLCIRKTSVPKITILSVFVLCMIAASVMLPKEEQWLLSQVKFYAIPLIEISVISLVVYKTRQTLRAFRNHSSNDTDFFTVLTLVCKEIFPRPLNGFMSTEIAVFYYLLGGGKTPLNAAYSFTYHKKNGVMSIVGMFVFIILIETIALHLFVDQWNVVLAWILSTISIYTSLQVIALARSLPKRPVVIDATNKSIALRYGFFNEATIPISQIESVALNRKTLPEDKSIVAFSPLHTFDTHNIIIHLKEPLTMNKIYGFTKTVNALAIAIDDRDRFVNMVEELMIDE